MTVDEKQLRELSLYFWGMVESVRIELIQAR